METYSKALNAGQFPILIGHYERKSATDPRRWNEETCAGPSSRNHIVRAESRFEVDLASLKSDSDRRDNYIRRNTLLTDSLPNAVFVPVVARGLPSPLPATGEFTFQVTGELTIRGVTRPVTWQVTASPGAGGIFSGTARTEFNFALFAIPIPRVASVLSVTDNIRLEYDFRLIPAPPPSAAGE